MKKLILIRHAHALTVYEAAVQTDAQRPLSSQGRQQAAQTAKTLLKQGIKPNIILTSPLLRALQTAKILSGIWQVPVCQENRLNGFYTDLEVRDFLLEKTKEEPIVAAVGHNPNIACVAQLFCNKLLHFSPGAFAVLEMEQEHSARLLSFGE